MNFMEVKNNMKEVIYNRDNLKEEDMTETVIRTKALLINGDSIFIGNENSVFQFPGGHLEENESFEECLKREIEEESGIKIDLNDIKGPFMKVIYMNRNWPEEGTNRKNEIYYYVVKTNKEPDLSKTNLTEGEKENNFKIEKFPLDKVVQIIKDNIPNNEKNKIISRDMIIAIEEYQKLNK